MKNVREWKLRKSDFLLLTYFLLRIIIMYKNLHKGYMYECK